MPAITIADLTNAKLDVDHIAAIATSTAPTATDRLGGVKNTMAGSIVAIESKMALFETAKTAALIAIPAKVAQIEDAKAAALIAIPAKVALVDTAVAASYVGQAEAAKKIAVDAANSTLSARYITAASRALMAEISPSFSLIYLTEAGREGLFQWSGSNLSAKVTADPYQGLYIAPSSTTTGASGAWVRQVLDRRYHLAWWGVTTGYGNNGHLPLQSALDLLPSGCTFLFPPYEVVCSAGVFSRSNNVAFLGYGYDSSLLRCETNAATESYWSTTALLCVQANGCSTDGITYQHRYHTAQAGGGFALQFDSRDGTAHKGFRIKGARFQNCSEGFIAFSDCYLTNALVPVSGVQIDYAEFIDLDYQAISLFGAQDVNIDFVRIKMREWTVARFTPPIRIIGSTDVHLNDFDIIGPGANPIAGGNRSYGVAVVTMGQGTANGSLINRRNRNVYIRGGKISRVIIGIVTQPVEGDLVINDVDMSNDLTSTTNATAILISAEAFAGVPQTFDRILIDNVRGRGFTRFVDAAGVLINEIELNACKWVGNARTPSLGEAAFFKFNTTGDGTRAPLLTKITKCSGHVNGAAIFSDIEVTGMLGSCVLEAYDNRMPFGGTGAVVAAAGTGGKVYTSAIDVGQNVGGALTQGDNKRWGADTWPMISTGSPGASSGGGSSGGGTVTERTTNGSFDLTTGWTLSATGSISGGNLNVGTTQYGANYQALLGSYVVGEVYNVVVVVASLGNATTRLDIGPSFSTSSTLSTVLVTGTNSLTFTVPTGSAGTDMRAGFVVYSAGSTVGAVISSISILKAP